MAEVRHPDAAATDEEREELKRDIDKLGRREFCNALRVNYMQVSNQLNGSQTLRNCMVDYYRNGLAVLKSGRKK